MCCFLLIITFVCLGLYVNGRYIIRVKINRPAVSIVPEHDVIWRWSGTGNAMADGDISTFCLVLFIVLWFSSLSSNSKVSGRAAILWLIFLLKFVSLLRSVTEACQSCQTRRILFFSRDKELQRQLSGLRTPVSSWPARVGTAV